MSVRARFVYFVISLVAMACLAVGAVEMASNNWTFGLLLCVIAFALVGAGFVIRRKLLSRHA